MNIDQFVYQEVKEIYMKELISPFFQIMKRVEIKVQNIYISFVFVITLRIKFVTYSPLQFINDAIGVQEGIYIIKQNEINVKTWIV